MEGSDLGPTEDPFKPTARCIHDTKKRQLVTRSGLPRQRCFVCHLHHKRAMYSPAAVRDFFGTVLQQVCHFKADVIAGDANAAAYKYHKAQEHQDLHNSSVAVMPREMQREANAGHPFERRLHINYLTNNNPPQLHAATDLDCCFQRNVEKMIKSAEGSAGLLHKITKPTRWRGEVPILEKEKEDARLLDRCEAKKKKRSKHWQCNEEIQSMQDKPWRNEELKECEEALSSLKEGDLEKASRLYKAKTGVGCDGFHPKVPLDLTKETKGEIVFFLRKVEQSGKRPQQASTTMFFLIPKNVTSERPIALMPTLIRWWEVLGAPEVAKWQQKYRVDRDATDGGNGGAQQTVWKIVMKMERLRGKTKEEDQGAVWRRHSSESAFLWPGLGISAFHGRFCGWCAVSSSTRGVYSSKDVRQNRSQPSLLSCQGPSGVVCFYVLYCRMR